MECLNCGLPTKIWGKTNKKYCNIKCQREYENKKRKLPKVEVKCKTCGDVFIGKNKLSKYCSYKCKAISEQERRSNKPKIKICKYCGKEFTPYTSLDKFCSANCRVNDTKSKRSRNWNKDKVDKIKGVKNPCYRNGNYAAGIKRSGIGQRLFTKNAKEIESLMISNVGYKYCEHCQTSIGLRYERHHIIFRSEKPNHTNLHNKENILILCVKCHNEFHKIKGLRNNIVEERNLDAIFGIDVLNK